MINMLSITSASYPSQLVNDDKKVDEKWLKQCIDGAINKVLYTNDVIRKTKGEKIENYNIVHGRLDQVKLRKALNPLHLEEDETDEEIFDLVTDGYTILLNPLNTLFGEELKRTFDPKAFVVNADAVSHKERLQKDKIEQVLTTMLSKEELSKDEVQKELDDLMLWKNYNLQTIHEKLANNVIGHYQNRLNTKLLFNEGWKDLIIAAEEIYYVGVANGEPYIKKCNPLQILYYGNGQSNKIEDASVIIEWGYMSVGAILQEFNRVLNEKDLKTIEKYLNFGLTSTGSRIQVTNEPPYMNLHNVLLPIEEMQSTPFGYNWFDRQGNILVIRVNWLSHRKIGELKYPDEFGDIQHKFVPENYKPDKLKGEEVEWFWGNEWMSGVKIGHETYVDIKINPVQIRSITNPAVCKPPYVGQVMNINSGKAFSVVDTVKELFYEYIVYSKKLKHLWLTNMGKVANIDIAGIPNGELEDGSKWTVERWLTFMKKHRIALRNSFQDDGRGHVYGNMQQSTGYIDMSAGQEIIQCMNFLQYLEGMIHKLIGVNPQRQGDINPAEAVTNAQQSIVYSATQTEQLFQVHEDIKIRTWRVFLETAKWCLKDKKELMQHLLDDSQIALLEFDGAVFFEADYDVQIMNTRKVQEFEQMMKTIADRAMANGTLGLSDLGMAYLANSPTAMIAQLKTAEDKRRKEGQEMEQQKMKMQQQQMQQVQQQIQMQHQFDMEKLKFERDTEIMKLEMTIKDKQLGDAFNAHITDQNSNGIEDQVEMDKLKLINEDNDKKRKHEAEEADKQRQFEANQNNLNRENDLKLAEKKRLVVK